MPAPKPIQLVSGIPTEVPAAQASSGVATADRVVATGADGLIDRTFLPFDPAVNMTASEAISAGDLINVFDDTGTSKIRKADASGGYAKKADGFAPDAIASGASGLVVLGDELLTGLSGLTIGAPYYLSTTPGAVTTTPPTAAGHLLQFVGKARSATELIFVAGGDIVVRG